MFIISKKKTVDYEKFIYFSDSLLKINLLKNCSLVVENCGKLTSFKQYKNYIILLKLFSN